MTLREWIDSLPDDEREALCLSDGWKAGAQAMLSALVDSGFISLIEAEDLAANKPISQILAG